MTEGMSGNSGSISGLELLTHFATLGCTGTLVLEERGRHVLFKLEQGHIDQQELVKHATRLDRHKLAFHFHPHAASDLPQLASCFPQSFIPSLRATPHLGVSERIPHEIIDVLTLLEYLHSKSLNACVMLERPVERGIILLLDGKIVAAFLENDGVVREGSDALRTIRRLARLADTSLLYRQLDPLTVQSIVGLSRSIPSKSAVNFTGVASGEHGYTFYQKGEPRWRVTAELNGRSGYFEAVTAPPELPMPDEPLGWESTRYRLTLRGRDALNPITELAMSFEQDYGKSGKRMLAHLAKGVTPEQLAEALKLELNVLRPQLGRLESQGLIQLSDDS